MSRRRRCPTWIAVLLTAAVGLAPEGVAGQSSDVPSVTLEETFEGPILEALTVEIRHAQDRGLPVAPLVLKALEGRSKAAPDSLIVRAVSALSQRLEQASAALGEGAPTSRLVAAAAALYVGVHADRIREMREAMPGEAMEMALVVLGDLVQRGVPVERASGAVLAMGSAGLDGPGFAEFRERVDSDIRTGLSPERATDVRVRGVLARFGGGEP